MSGLQGRGGAAEQGRGDTPRDRRRPVWPLLTNPDPLEQIQRLKWLRDNLASGWDHPILATYDATLAKLIPEAQRAARRVARV